MDAGMELGRGPASGRIERRAIDEAEPEPHGHRVIEPRRDNELPISPRSSGRSLRILRSEGARDGARERQQTTALEVDEDDAATTIDLEVAQRLEHAVSRIVGHADLVLAHDADDPSVTAA